MHLCAAKCKPRGECRQKGVETAPAGACRSGAKPPLRTTALKARLLACRRPFFSSGNPATPRRASAEACRAKRPPKAAVRGERGRRPCSQAAWRKSAAFSTSWNTAAPQPKLPGRRCLFLRTVQPGGTHSSTLRAMASPAAQSCGSLVTFSYSEGFTIKPASSRTAGHTVLRVT